MKVKMYLAQNCDMTSPFCLTLPAYLVFHIDKLSI
jgi:hypothetical protein